MKRTKLIRRLLAAMLAVSLLCVFPVSATSTEKTDTVTVQIVTKPIFAAYIEPFNGDYAIFHEAATGKTGVMDCYGNIKMILTGGDPFVFANGLATERKNGGFALIGRNGKPLTGYTLYLGKDLYDSVTGYTGYVFAEDNERTYVFDKDGKNPLKKTYFRIHGLQNGELTYLTKDGKIGIDKIDGTTVFPAIYEGLTQGAAGEYIFAKERINGYGIMDKDGKVLLAPQYDDIMYCQGPYYRAVKNGKEGLITIVDGQIIPCDYERVDYLGGKLVFVRYESSDTFGLMLTDGTQLLECSHNYYEHSGELVLFADNEKCSVVKMDGTVLFRDIFGERNIVANGLFLHGINGNTEIYDADGKLLNTIPNALPEKIDSEFACVYRNGKYAFVGADGQLTSDFIYDRYFTNNIEGILGVFRNGKWNLIDINGKELLDFDLDEPPMFSNFSYPYGKQESCYAAYVSDKYRGVLKVTQPGELPFTDVKRTDWFYNGAKFCYEKGIMNGTSAVQFSPNVNTTRSMIVTILYSLSGADKPTCANPFTDVKNGQWYTDAVLWAAENGIVSGYGNGKFGTNDLLTREQLAVILYSYAKKYGKDVSASADLGQYPDAGKVSSWAKTAVSWAVANSLISGNVINGKTMLDPQGKATRAMVACIMMRLAELKDAPVKPGGDVILPPDPFT